MVSNCMVWYESERKRQNSSCPADRGRSEEVKGVRSRQMRVASLSPSAMVMSGSELLLGPCQDSWL